MTKKNMTNVYARTRKPWHLLLLHNVFFGTGRCGQAIRETPTLLWPEEWPQRLRAKGFANSSLVLSS
jgi:hypothetical protein